MTAHVIMVTDKSGSMMSLAEDVRGGFNAFLDDLAKTEDVDYRITTALFNTEYFLLCVDAEIKHAPRLSRDNYIPGGFTALNDAVGQAISDFEHRVPELGEGDKVILVIQTDGHENASVEFRHPSIIKEMIQQRINTGKWVVLYIGAGVDSWTQAQSIGVDRNSYVNTPNTRAATHNTYGAMGQTVRSAYKGDTDFAEVIRKANKNS